MSEQYLEVCLFVCLFFVPGEHAQKPKKLHKALCSVQFLASFISSDFEVLYPILHVAKR